jgi:hypothetical protein
MVHLLVVVLIIEVDNFDLRLIDLERDAQFLVTNRLQVPFRSPVILWAFQPGTVRSSLS